jgi:beta-glucosidase
MLDHYQRMIEGCRERGLTPMVTFNHFTCPRWFAATGGWLNEKSPDLFARYCERSARHLGASIGYATTLNEPNLMRLLKWFGLPPQIFETQRAMLKAAAAAARSPTFVPANATNFEDHEWHLPILLAAPRGMRDQGRASDLPSA